MEALTFQAASDLRAQQYRIVRHSAAGQVDIASGAVTQNAVAGILLNSPRAGEAASVGFWGESQVYAGAAVAHGALVAPDGTGRAVTANSGDWTLGQALEAAGAAGELIRVLVRLPAVRITY
jgi:hypothetical protein